MKTPLFKITTLALMAYGALLGGPLLAQSGSSGPSFSCARVAEGGVEDMICGDRELSLQDRIMARAYEKARNAVRGSEGLGALIQTQQIWLAERAACATLRTQKGFCVENTTAERIEVLDQWAALKTNPERASRQPQKTGTTAGSRPPPGPSFNCANARTSVERTICASRDLSLQDRQIASLYAQLQRNVGNNVNHAAFATQEQRSYIANRNRCARTSQTISACLQVAHENRIMRLEEFIAEIESRP